MNNYIKYKTSGINWIGEIPHSWQMIQLKYLTENYDNLRIPVKAEDRGNMQGKYPYYGATGIIDYVNDYIFEGEYLLIGEDGAPFFQSNDVAFIATGKFWVNNHAHILKTRDNCNIRFLKHVLNSVDFSEYITGSTRDKLTQSSLSKITLPFPSLSEQQAIADFLDCKTAQIDKLIAKKQRLIELLQEYRSALINQAVTKGLDPNVPMKDSGYEWLGKIPEHWELRRLKFMALIELSNVDKHTKEEETPVFLCNYSDIYNNDFIKPDMDFMKATASEKEIKKFSLKKGDVIITKDSESWDDIAVPAFVTENMDNVLCGYHLAQIHSISINENYLFWALCASSINDQYKVETHGITRYGLGKGAIENSHIPMPTSKEQDEIAKLLNQKTGQIDLLVAKIEREIKQLIDYRTSLISEVVTGKIDVRGWKGMEDGISADCS